MIQSKRRSSGFLWFCLIITIVFMGGGIAGIINSGSGPYCDLVEFVICFLLFGIGLRLFITALYYFDKLTIDNDTLYVKSFFGYTRKKISLSSIQYWTEKIEHERGRAYLKLNLFGAKKLYTVYTRFYDNNEAIIEAITQYAVRDTEKEHHAAIVKKINASFFLFALSISVLALSAYFFFKMPAAPVTSVQLSTIKDVLSEDPIVFKGSKGSSYIKFVLKSYPEFEFNISGQAYSATYVNDFKQEMEQGDSVTLRIDKTEFQQKISHEMPLGFFNKTVNYKRIDVVEVAGKNHVFLSLNDYNAAHVEMDNKQVALMLFILSICLVLMGRQQRLKAIKMKNA